MGKMGIKGNLKKGVDELKYKITSKFNDMSDFRNHPHTGIDIGVPKDTPLNNIHEGIVDRILHNPNGIGNAVTVKWSYGKEMIYGHLSKINVHKGDHVKVGDLLGQTGNSGHTSGVNGGYHLHLGLKNENGDFINPSAYVDRIQNMGSSSKLHEMINNSFCVNPNATIDKSSMLDMMNTGLDQFKDIMEHLTLNIITFLGHINIINIIHSIMHFF